MSDKKFINREVSWNYFNYRVLQEAKDPDVPLYDRIKFLSIFSSNLDEYFRVRIASLRLLIREKEMKNPDFNPRKLLKKLYKIIDAQQTELGMIFRERILPELKMLNIHFPAIPFPLGLKDLTLKEERINREFEICELDLKYLSDYFDNYILPELNPIVLFKKKIKVFLKNRQLYMGIILEEKNKRTVAKRRNRKYAILEIPSNRLNRFVAIPEVKVTDDLSLSVKTKQNETEALHSKVNVYFIDDVIRLNLEKLFPEYIIAGAYSIKLNRDSELYLGDEFSGNLLAKIKASLKKRELGIPSRFLYDPAIPKRFLLYLKDTLELSNSDLFAGGKYHNFFDFIKLPNYDNRIPSYEIPVPLRCRAIEEQANILDAIEKRDILLHYPYYSYDYLQTFLNKVSEDKDVQKIKITLYRIAEDSAVVRALIKGALNGKEVTVFVELKSRFDESNNIQWADELEKAGVKVIYSIPGIKVHSKILFVECKVYPEKLEGAEKKKDEDICSESVKRFSYLSTGNFNEKTARFYVDFGFFTSNKEICDDVASVFNFVENQEKDLKFRHLLVGQFNLRSELENIFDEVIHSKKSMDREIILKLNNLEDKKMIKKIIEATAVGVKVKIIVRSVCCLNPELKKIGDRIEVISIVDKYLEHSRIYVFRYNKSEKIFLSSSDFMKRNLSRRVETAFPIYSEELKREILDVISFYLNDNCKARIIDKDGRNEYKTSKDGKRIRVQFDLYEYYMKKENS